MRFLLVNRFFGSEQTPTGRMLRDVAGELSLRGHDVTVLTSNGQYVGNPGQLQNEVEKIRCIQINALHFGRVLSWGYFWIRCIPWLASSRWDRCVLLSDPPFLPFAAWLTSIFRSSNQRIWWWTMDLYPEALVAANLVRDSSTLNRCLRYLNDLGLRKTDGVVALGHRQLQRLQSYKSWDFVPPSAAVIPPWDNRELPEIASMHNGVLNRFGWQNKKLALYTGNLGEGHLFQQFIDAASWFVELGRSDWLLVFVVRGGGRPKLETACASLKNVVILDYFPDSETRDLLWSATVHLVSMKPGWEGVIVPSKLFGALQTRAPILFLGPADADTATIITSLDRGMTLPPSSTGPEVGRTLDELALPSRRREPHRSKASNAVAECISA